MPGRSSALRFAAFAAALVVAACAMPSEQPDPKDAAVDSSLRAAALASQEVRNYTGAAAYYASLYEREPDDLDVVLGYARNLRFVGDVDRAIAVLELALREHPDEIALIAEYGRALLAADRAADALPQLERAAEAAPTDWKVRSALGIAHDLLGDYDKAVLAYESALVLAPDSSAVLNNLALSQAMAGQIDEGIATLRRAVLRPAAGVQERQNLALLLALDGGLDEAEQLIEADLPREMARQNIRLLRGFAAARDEGATAPEVLAGLPVLTTAPELAPVPPTVDVAVAPVPATTVPDAAPDAEPDFATAAAQAADEAFAALAGGSSTAAQGYGAQLASYASEADAATGRATLERTLGGTAAGRDLVVVPVVLADQSPVYRVYAGSFGTVEEARATCAAVRAAGVACLVSAAP